MPDFNYEALDDKGIMVKGQAQGRMPTKSSLRCNKKG